MWRGGHIETTKMLINTENTVMDTKLLLPLRKKMFYDLIRTLKRLGFIYMCMYFILFSLEGELQIAK